MTQISREEVLRLAQLSRLQLDDTEIDELSTDIANILDYVKQLDELDTDAIEPLYQVTGLENVWREDKIIDSEVSREDLLALAPESADGQIKVPKVL